MLGCPPLSCLLRYVLGRLWQLPFDCCYEGGCAWRRGFSSPLITILGQVLLLPLPPFLSAIVTVHCVPATGFLGRDTQPHLQAAVGRAGLHGTSSMQAPGLQPSGYLPYDTARGSLFAAVSSIQGGQVPLRGITTCLPSSRCPPPPRSTAGQRWEKEALCSTDQSS